MDYTWLVTNTSIRQDGAYVVSYDVYYLDERDDKQIVRADHVDMPGTTPPTPEEVRKAISEKVASYTEEKNAAKEANEALEGLKG